MERNHNYHFFENRYFINPYRSLFVFDNGSIPYVGKKRKQVSDWEIICQK